MTEDRSVAIALWDASKTHLVHLVQRAFPHLLQSTDLATVLFPSEVNLSITALSNLSNDMKLVDLELGSPLSEENTLSPTV